jgi:hypothetical protein
LARLYYLKACLQDSRFSTHQSKIQNLKSKMVSFACAALANNLPFRAQEELSMRRILALITVLAMAAILSGCGRSDTANANNSNGDDGITGQGQTVSNSNMAPTGGPGPEPENAGSVGKSSGSGDKSDATANSKSANSKTTESKKR